MLCAAPTAPGWTVDEAARAAAMATYDLESLRDSSALKQITDFAAALCEAPVALVSLVETTRQTFIARTGLSETETPREMSFCAHAMLGDGIMVVPDATRDPRFADNALVTGDLHIRFYAGAPLISDDGIPLGSLCVIDTVPRDGLTPLQMQGLATLADNVMARLRDSRDAAAWRAAERNTRRQLTDSEDRFRTLADTMPQMVWSTLPDGFHDYYNARWYEFTGTPQGSTDGEGWNDVFHPEDQARAWDVWRHSLGTGDPYQIEYRLRHFDGTYRWVLGRALPIRDAAGRITRWFGTCTDIHEQKLALHERELISQELSHRIKNIFSVISGLISFAARSRPAFAPVAADLRQRITALGRAHDFVRPHSPASRPMVKQDSLHGLLAELFEPYRREDRQPIAIAGDEIPIDDRSATPLALLFHELATNATKYGALSTDDGSVDVTVAREGDHATLRWAEQDGPPVREPDGPHGFGSQLIELSAVRQLGGSVMREWRPEGLVVIVRVPVAAFSRT
ncbi:PAS domain-containing protein [Sphingomonas sp. RP10(2022)]|uniref:histidine kinase n=1 Tax=Sphingomonas liriopis TaxID=2949094 RepID=A0A9X2HV38_9SPHN|nr:PAS domain-containing protein [Sphingomonas liriopis]MCP3734103.1 PAS domain-containing protein [Sphingomonas liriopis]